MSSQFMAYVEKDPEWHREVMQHWYRTCLRGNHDYEREPMGSKVIGPCETCGFKADVADKRYRNPMSEGIAWRKIASCLEHDHCDLARMVGDDRNWHVDRHDLIPIDDDAYCGSCGQIGCQHGG